jgi:hypothetical protein
MSQVPVNKDELSSFIQNYQKRSISLNKFLISDPSTDFNRRQMATIIENYERDNGNPRTKQETNDRIERLKQLLAEIYPPRSEAAQAGRAAPPAPSTTFRPAAPPAPSTTFRPAPIFSSQAAPPPPTLQLQSELAQPSTLSQVSSQAVCQTFTFKQLHEMRHEVRKMASMAASMASGMISQIDRLEAAMGGKSLRQHPYEKKTPKYLVSEGIKPFDIRVFDTSREEQEKQRKSVFSFLDQTGATSNAMDAFEKYNSTDGHIEMIFDQFKNYFTAYARSLHAEEQEKQRKSVFSFLDQTGATSNAMDAFEQYNSTDGHIEMIFDQFNNYFTAYARARSLHAAAGASGGKSRYKKYFKTKKRSHSYKKHSKSKKYFK